MDNLWIRRPIRQSWRQWSSPVAGRPLYIAKAEKQGRTEAEVDEIICWLSVYSPKQLEAQHTKQTDFEIFFATAPQLNPSRALFKGVICGIRIEEIEEPAIQEIRYLGKLIDVPAKGKVMEKFLRVGPVEYSYRSHNNPVEWGYGMGQAAGVLKPHWSFWIVGTLALLFNCAGIANLFSQLDAQTVAALPEIYRSVIENRAVWATAAFALAVGGGVAGCVLLLFRKSIAIYLFFASLLGAAVTLIDTLGISGPIAISAGFVIGNIVQLAVTVFLVWYTRYAARRNWIS